MAMRGRVLEMLEGMVVRGCIDIDAVSHSLRDNKTGSFIDYVAMRAGKRRGRWRAQ